ncbi:gluconate 2-dehydrogenase subunit 3 family protein [Lentiprolixibacter aurantiacus]|uniref:Gluconate 2-dehydrogenase subunit 3 family protein n=1 Tax=Lentiprolixibacter aurantiacus TaxID=2993939 RepID=A0AAE3MJ83_9FLAO|nr:gluconate 2-dehydrogenase subunit 3 family protein [Lentiprolixibacter aurantiacus]MCX2718700.1 gluconate 2-dehydrogenase subunit 3 family protein [Lentiprolixibacter aurantiacus]
MDRRKALKNMGLAMGYTVATPAVMSLLNNCKTESAASWTPRFFSPGEGNVLTHIVDILLPKTDTPSASEVNVHIFIDRYLDEVMPLEQQGFIRMLMGKFTGSALRASGKEDPSDLDSDDIEPILASALKVPDPEKEKANEEALAAYMAARSKGETADLAEEVANANLAKSLRSFSIWSYKNTEYVGEKVLPYAPVPGVNIACGDLNELTGGKVWSPQM